MDNTLKLIGNIVLLAITPLSLLLSDYIGKKDRAAIASKLEEVTKKLEIHDKEAIETEVIAALFSNTIFADKDGKITSATPGAAKLFGYTQSELKEMHINDLMPERYKGQHNPAFKKRAEEPYDPEKVVTVPQCYGLHKNGTEISVEVRTRMIIDNGELRLFARFTETKDINVVKLEKHS